MKLRSRSALPGQAVSRTARRSAVAVVTAVATLGVAGCSVFSPATVLKPYEPSDGTGGSLEGVQLRNVLLVSSGVDEPGVLSAVLVNNGEADATVSVSVDVAAGATAAQTFDVAVGQALHIGDVAALEGAVATDDETAPGQTIPWLQVPQIPVTPGETVPVTFSVSGQSQELQAPVLLPCFEYAPLTPTPSAAADEESTGTTATATTAAVSVTCGPAVGEESSEEH